MEYFSLNCPELLDYYIQAYENIIAYDGDFLEPEDVRDKNM